MIKVEWPRGPKEVKLNRIAPMFFNPDVSVEEEIRQAALWKQAQRDSEKRSRKLINEWKHEMNPCTVKNEVTPEMIERAKEYPVENLIEVIRGKAQCISGEHADKRPSMNIKNNRVKCFACHFKGDSIDVYMKLHGATFHEAVRALS